MFKRVKCASVCCTAIILLLFLLLRILNQSSRRLTRVTPIGEVALTLPVNTRPPDDDSTRLKHVSPMNAYQRFYPLTLSSCKNVCNRNESHVCNVTNNKNWDKQLQSGYVTGVPLYQENEYMFPFEKFYQKFGPLEDMKKLPDQKESVIYHVDSRGFPRKVSQVTCNHMEKLTFRVDLKDSYGYQRTDGGDDIRAWIKGNPTDDKKYDFSSAGKVHDLNNGSYLVTITCAWAGFAALKVGIAYPREYIRTALDNSRRGVHVLITGTFSRKGIEEETICQNHPNIPGRPCLCNFTDLNQLPFFCGKPLNKRLSCKDIAFTQSINSQAKFVYTAAEKKISTSMTREASESTIQQEIKINIINEDLVKLPKKPCYELRKSESWDFQYSRGFWSNDGQWTSFLCRQPALTPSWVTNCLQNTSIWLIGDSNSAITFRTLQSLTGSSTNRRKSGVSQNKKRNINLTVTNHEYTIHSGGRRRMPKRTGVSRFVDKIPAVGKHYVVFHYYLHPSRSHISAIYMRLKELRRTILRLLKRVPGVSVIVRGPHISTIEASRNHMLGGDTLAIYIIAFWHEIFHDMKDRVLFVDGWNMSVAMENSKYHPDVKFTNQLIRTIVSFHCKQS